MTADHFRHAYDSLRATGYTGSRAEFGALVLANPSVFRGSVVAGARAWCVERGALTPPPARPVLHALPAALHQAP